MYFLTVKMARVRNLSVSVANGVISLTILLIAPMGLFAVIEYFVDCGGDLWKFDGERSRDCLFAT